VAVQAQAGFQPQRVTRAQAGGLDLGLVEQGQRQPLGFAGRHRDLEAVFAGVAAAGDEAGAAGQLEQAAGHEHQPLHAGVQPAQRGGRLRPLQRQQRAFGHRDDVAAVADAFLQLAQVVHLAAGVHHQQQVAEAGLGGGGVGAGHHQVVVDAAGEVDDEAVALAAGREAEHVDRDHGFQCGGGVGADEADLAHVGHVEQRRRVAAVAVLGDHAFLVLHRHRVTGERHHARAQPQVQVVQGGGLQVAHGTDSFTGGCGMAPRCPPPRLAPAVRFT
jgi:hypothetical protein